MSNSTDDRSSDGRDESEIASSETSTADLALWKPSLGALLLFGIVAGALLGAMDGALCYYIIGWFESAEIAAGWGLGLGIAGGIFVVVVRRVIWGPDVSATVGTILGLLYGIAPGLGMLYHFIFEHHWVRVPVYLLAGSIMACSMAGLLIGGLLDRITDEVIARFNRLQS